jgi:hypothetical protein
MQFLSPPTIDRCKTKCSTFLLKSAKKKSIEQQKNLRTPRAEKVLSSPNKLKAKDNFLAMTKFWKNIGKEKQFFKLEIACQKI